MPSIRDICEMVPVIPVLVVEDVAAAGPLAMALAKGGLNVLEVTLRTPAALDVLTAMKEAAPAAVVGAGTLLTPRDVRAAKAAGAEFGVSPGSTDALLDAAAGEGLPMLPGAATPSDVMRYLARGLETMKFFPAGPAGGVSYLKALASPFPGAKFCPTGGITFESMGDYLALKNVLCVGGSWVAPGEAVAAGNWSEIERLAREAFEAGQKVPA